jgi:hypothetical protein
MSLGKEEPTKLVIGLSGSPYLKIQTSPRLQRKKSLDIEKILRELSPQR